MYQLQTVQPGDLTQHLVQKLNTLIEKCNQGFYTQGTQVLDATANNTLTLVPAAALQHLHLLELRVLVWSLEADANPIVPKLALGTNANADNVLSLTNLPTQTMTIHTWLLPAALVDVSSQGLKLRIQAGNYAQFRVQFWLTGLIVAEQA